MEAVVDAVDFEAEVAVEARGHADPLAHLLVLHTGI